MPRFRAGCNTVMQVYLSYLVSVMERNATSHTQGGSEQQQYNRSSFSFIFSRDLLCFVEFASVSSVCLRCCGSCTAVRCGVTTTYSDSCLCCWIRSKRRRETKAQWQPLSAPLSWKCCEGIRCTLLYVLLIVLFVCAPGFVFVNVFVCVYVLSCTSIGVRMTALSLSLTVDSVGPASTA